MTRSTALGLVVAASAVGIVIGASFGNWFQSPTDVPSPQLAELRTITAKLESLRAALDEERGYRGALELELALLRQELARDEEAESSPVASLTADPLGAATDGESAPEPQPTASERQGWFDEAVLRKRGFDEERAEWLRERFEALQMDELYLRDRASREGWLIKPRYHLRVQKLRNEARENLGISDYDWLLYASGQNNRVRVRDVLQNSPAAAAGIEPGDLILRYDDVAVLSLRELTFATAQGELGSSVAVEVLRDGDVQRLYVSRGPLGARIAAVRRAPPIDR